MKTQSHLLSSLYVLLNYLHNATADGTRVRSLTLAFPQLEKHVCLQLHQFLISSFSPHSFLYHLSTHPPQYFPLPCIQSYTSVSDIDHVLFQYTANGFAVVLYILILTNLLTAINRNIQICIICNTCLYWSLFIILYRVLQKSLDARGNMSNIDCQDTLVPLFPFDFLFRTVDPEHNMHRYCEMCSLLLYYQWQTLCVNTAVEFVRLTGFLVRIIFKNMQGNGCTNGPAPVTEQHFNKRSNHHPLYTKT